MASWATLSQSLVQLEVEIRSVKQPIRTKALDKLHHLLDTRPDELAQLLRGDVHTSEVSWSDLINSAHEACIQQVSRLGEIQGQKGLGTVEQKNHVHLNVLQKLISLANKDTVDVSLSSILNKAFHCFGNRWMVQYFGMCYLQIVYRNVLSTVDQLQEITMSEWSRLLSYCFQMFDNKHIQKLALLQCFPLIIDVGCKYTFLGMDLVQYTPILEQIASSNLEYNALSELIKTIGGFCTNLALDCRLTVCQFLENVLGVIIKSYNHRLNEDSKIIFYQLLTLTVVVHDPEVDFDGSSKGYAVNRDVWYKHLCNMFHLVQSDIRQMNSQTIRFQNNPTICESFVQMAASVCAAIFWNDLVWANQESIAEPRSKKRRRSTKIEGIMELIEYEKGKFCWRWLSIFSYLLDTHPKCVRTEDIQPILQMLHDFQLTIQYPVQVKILQKIASTILTNESTIQKGSTIIEEAFCTEIWVNIAQTAFRTTSSNLLSENIQLLRVIVCYEKPLPFNFIESILKTFLSNSIRKSNDAVQLLIDIYKYYNVDALGDCKDYRYQTMKWLHTTGNILHFVHINDELVSELTVLCLFSKIDKGIFKRDLRLDKGEQNSYSKYIEGLRLNLMRKSLEKLIVYDPDLTERTFTVTHRDLPQPNTLKCVVNEVQFQMLFEILNPDKEIQDESNNLEAFNRITSTLCMYLKLLGQLIVYESMDKLQLDKTFLAKKAHIKVGQLDMCIAKFKTCSEFTDKYAMDVIERLSRVFDKNQHPILKDIILSHHMPETILWLRRRACNEAGRDSKCIQIRSVDELNFYNRLRFEAFMNLSFFAHGPNEMDAFNAVDEFEFNLNSNTDLLIVHRMVKELLKHKPTQQKAEWCFNHVKTICQLYHKKQTICQLVIDLIPDLANYIPIFPEMTADFIVLIESFLAQCKRKKYGPVLTQSLILAMRAVVQSHANHLGEEEFQKLFFVLSRFLPPNKLMIQYATIETLIVLFDADQIRSRCTQNVNVTQFQRAVFDHILIGIQNKQPTDCETDNHVADIDSNSRYLCVNVQILCVIICKSYILRKEATFLLAEFAFVHELSKEYLQKVILMICKQLNVDHATFINENIEYLLSWWLIKNYQLAKFPWFIAPCTTQNDFFNDHIETLTICILRHRPNILEDFVPLIPGETITSIIQPILPNCLAFLTPLFANCSKMPEKYLTNGREMYVLLQENVHELKKIEMVKDVEIIEYILMNTWDPDKFRSFFHFDIDFQAEDHMIDTKQLNQCFDYMKANLQKPAYPIKNFVVEYCNKQPFKVFRIIHSLKCLIHQSRFVELKLVTMLQYCTFLEHVIKYLIHDQIGPKAKKEQAQKIKSFLVRDTIHFLCNLLLNAKDLDSKIVRSTVEYLYAFCDQILPKCVAYFESCFNLTVSTLVEIVDRTSVNPTDAILTTATKCLRYLIIDLGNSFTKEISLLDNFPSRPIFDELRCRHTLIKYKGRKFGLAEELDCFLQIDTRKTDGMIALREQLSLKKDELIDVFVDHQSMVKKSGEYENSRLHRLVLSLIESVKGTDATASIEAAKCLGELGPSDFSTIVLRPDSQLYTYKHFSTFERATIHMCRVVLKTLNQMLVHPDPYVVKVVYKAIAFLMKYQEIQSIADEYPYPELFVVENPRSGPIYNEPTADTLKLLELFCKYEKEEHSKWVKSFVIELLRLFGDKHLGQVAHLHLTFAEELLPLLTHMLLSCNKIVNLITVLRNSVEFFFQKHCDYIQSTELTADKFSYIYLKRASIKSMLNVTECIRMFNLFNLHNKLELNYLNVAKAAQYCDAHFTSILYSDLWSIEQKDSATAKTNPIMCKIMKEAYMSLGEDAAVTSFLDPIENRSMYLQLNQSWNRIFLEHDAQTYSALDNIVAVKTHLATAGLYGLSNMISQQTSPSQYECAWRLSDWSILDKPSVNSADESNFEQSHYAALRCLQSKDEMGAEEAIVQARSNIIADLKSASLECTNNVYKYMQRLALIQQVDDFLSVQFNRAESVNQNVFDKWRFQDQITCSDFKYKEPILAQRITIFKTAGLRATRKLQNTFNVRADILHSMILNVATECRLEGKTNLAIRYLAVLYTLTTSNEIKNKLWLEDAQLSWKLNDHVMTKKLLNMSLSSNEVESTLSRATAFRIYGEFLAESRAENVKFLIDKYFKNSLKFLDNIKKSQVALCDRMHITNESLSEFILDNQIKAYESIAKYSDREYTRVRAYMRSDLFERKKRSVAKNLQTVSEMGGSSNKTKDLMRTRVVLNKNTEIDNNEIDATQDEHDQFLVLAIFNYVKASALCEAPKYSVIFRIISLWFSNKDNKEVTQHLKEMLPQIPSYNFMVVLPQIAARLTNNETTFGKLVFDLMERCAIEHPQHAMYQVLALFNAYEDDTSIISNTPEPRVLGAKQMVTKLQMNEKTTLVLSQMTDMCKALIAFANKDTDRISSKEPIRKLANLSFVHCPTLALPLCKNNNYKNLITVHKWTDSMSLVGGINAPKKISCLCSDGKEYPQLLKAKDDLRQDAIMQQVFNILNELLDTHRTTQKSRLSVRTYRVVPLTQRSGILEWCSNTVPLAVYLVGAPNKPGAHERYHPDDLKPNQCRKIIHTYNKDKIPINRKMEIFQQLCTKFHPVLHYFFFEKFHRPGEWFERRLAYTKSVATTSMIGYVLGIGDRHVSNILIDEKTAELIHIDFGIAFEQSKCLPTPETVPFRLTQDMVAAFGVSGVDGIFRKSCESTMEVLRLNKTTIVTILEVLLYDPLYAWALSAKNVYSRQDIEREDDEIVDEKNIMAERALTRMEAKLNGEEEGTSGNTSTVESQVDLLITEAMSPYNLCRLFEGWQAYL